MRAMVDLRFQIVAAVVVAALAGTGVRAKDSAKQREGMIQRRAVMLSRKRAAVYKSDPKTFFSRYIQDKYCVIGGQLEKPLRLSGNVVQVIDEHNILLSRMSPFPSVWVTDIASTAGFADGTACEVVCMRWGTKSYTTVLGAKATARQYKPARMAKLRDMQAAIDAGVDVYAMVLEDYPIEQEAKESIAGK